jgi:hypothetical protein
MVFAIWGGSFLEPDPFNYFFGYGIATNIGASLLWGFIAGFIGYFVARKVKAAWARLHAKLDAHHAETHKQLDVHAELHAVHAVSLQEVHVKLDHTRQLLEAQFPKPKTPPPGSAHTGRAPSE